MSDEYPSDLRYTQEHEWARLEGNVATVGRDPSSDLVLNDPKCSRRHAVIEAGGLECYPVCAEPVRAPKRRHRRRRA